MTYPNEGFDKIAVNFIRIETFCTKCRITFPFRSKLYNHLKNSCLKTFLHSFFTQTALSISIIAFKIVHQSFNSRLAFSGLTYTIVLITFTPEHLPLDSNIDLTTCFDIRCGVILVDKTWLSKCLLMQKINIMLTPLKVWKIRASKHKSGEFAALSLYFPSKNDMGQWVYASLTCKIHLIKDLRANLLIGNNIMSLKGFIIDIKRRSVFIENCGVTVPIHARQTGQFLIRRLLASQETVIFFYSEAMVSLIPLALPNVLNFLFYLAIHNNLILFTHLIDHHTSKVLVKNTSN